VAALSQSSSVDELHWLDVPERVQYKLCATVCRCLQHKAPQYMIDCCVYTSDIAHRQHLRSAGCHQLLVPRHRRSMFGRQAYSVAGPAAWNSLPDYVRDLTRSVDSFRHDLKTLLFSFYYHTQHIRGFAIMRYTNLLLTLRLTAVQQKLTLLLPSTAQHHNHIGWLLRETSHLLSLLCF